jgi:3-oxoacyl-[acyl-carrier protein] reductase
MGRTRRQDRQPHLRTVARADAREDRLRRDQGAIEALTVTLSAEVGHKDITVNAVNPGPTNTGWMTEELKRELASRFPTGRVGEPEDAARLVVFLAGNEAAWITGQIIHSEGSFLRG